MNPKVVQHAISERNFERVSQHGSSLKFYSGRLTKEIAEIDRSGCEIGRFVRRERGAAETVDSLWKVRVTV